MGRYYGGQEYTGRYRGGQAVSKIQRGGEEYFTTGPTDRAGVLTVNATRASRGANIAYEIADADGISSVSSVVMLASDDTRSDVTSEINRDDANTFSGTSRRLNNKWRSGSITITYVDSTSSASHTLTQNWSV